jgi:hypothetical protein
MISEIKNRQTSVTSLASSAKTETSAAVAKEDSVESVASVDAVTLGTTKSSAGTYTRTARKLNASDLQTIKDAADQRYESMLALVKQLLAKQGEAAKKASGAKDDDETQSVSEAQAAISEDGDWGVKAVSDRIVQFAIAISGGDKSKYDELKSSIDKGFQEATKTWGGDLPGISQDTYKEVMRKLDAWKNDETQNV